jgi:hypothetical protein
MMSMLAAAAAMMAYQLATGTPPGPGAILINSIIADRDYHMCAHPQVLSPDTLSPWTLVMVTTACQSNQPYKGALRGSGSTASMALQASCWIQILHTGPTHGLQAK